MNSAKFYIRVQIVDMNDDKVLATGTCQTDIVDGNDLKAAAAIAALDAYSYIRPKKEKSNV